MAHMNQHPVLQAIVQRWTKGSVTTAPSPPNGVSGLSTNPASNEDLTISEASDSSLLIRNVAIATDFTPWSDRAMQHALAIAHRFGAVLHVVHAVRRSEFVFVPDMMVPIHELAERDCENLMGLLRATHSLDGIEHHCWNLDGECSEIFGEFVRDHKIDLLVLGTRGRSGISKLLMGSIAEDIARCVSCPVLAIGPCSPDATRHLDVKKVLFATDFSMEPSAAIPYLLTAVQTWEAEIDVLPLGLSVNSKWQQAVEVFKRKLDVLAAHNQKLLVVSHIKAGAPSATILDFARRKQEDLIILSLDHRPPYSEPRLSHTYEIVRQARCPVLSVRSQGR
jgi:nucleotide-binding universal stress UspA family protein